MFERLFFDRRDRDLLRVVNDVLELRDTFGAKGLLEPHLHPHGIKDMAWDKGLRIAYAVAKLLGSLETGEAADRLTALRALREEVLTTAQGVLRKNTARVLLSIMKDLVRARGDEIRQLMLARDFRAAATSKPRVVRAFLRHYHLLEMPEEWNQLAFDDHVHDANTKGRKSATHLIMDAWIKGIRRLMVIYYNHVRPEVAAELLESAAIMGVSVQIGLEYSAVHRGRYAKIIWVPSGLDEPGDFQDFLTKPAMAELMALGREASAWRRRYVDMVFTEFNEQHRPALNEAYDMEMQPLLREEFTRFVGSGQASLLHLGKFIHGKLLPHLQARLERLRAAHAISPQAERARIENLICDMNSLDAEGIIDHFLRPEVNPDLPDPEIPASGEERPLLLTLSPAELMAKLRAVRSGYQATLTLSGLSVEDVLEILYDCRGAITHLEVYNLKDQAENRSADIRDILALQEAFNSRNAIKLKRFIGHVLQKVLEAGGPDAESCAGKLTAMLCDIASLRELYNRKPLETRIGSDSTGRSCRKHGMGLVVGRTLPPRARRELTRTGRCIPLRAVHFSRVARMPSDEGEGNGGPLSRLARLARREPLATLLARREREHVVQGYRPANGACGDIYTLGGTADVCGNGFCLRSGLSRPPKPRLGLRYLNSDFKNALKVLLGLIPAFLTFALTKDWWLLAYLGAFIWFGITGVRNVIQSVLGGGGIGRSSLLRWKDYVSWDRLCDSLLYTGFSVPLLDWLVKTVLLDHGFGVTVSSAPLTLYAVMALANGLYISSHNLLRGLPKEAVVGNLFRSILSIPLAVAFNALAAGLLGAFGVAAVADVLQKWAAVISKLASDCVAGVIEGLADRAHNIRMRDWDYRGKLEQVFGAWEQLEMLYPQQDAGQILQSPCTCMRELERDASGLARVYIVNALDLLYFWMYQPRARSALVRFMRRMTREERKAFLLSQYVLSCKREICQLFLDGIVGQNFAKPMAFYLGHGETYLDAVQRLAVRLGAAGNGHALVDPRCPLPQQAKAMQEIMPN
ncbi:hypothetical protein [Desulfocurvibacter africanus]|uniref:hypothetical protein n=1 Tax=Desulfocurvibacter africanus TaxID=873 RepID=UPI0003FF7728|nr:hypothetical protein [Desulfocurvibacter africanus]